MENTPVPVVSVVIPNYNHAPYLRQRIDSVLQQTVQDMEVILLDDYSTDGSRAIIESYRAEPRVAIHYNSANSGSVFKQWNKGMALARGEYVWIAESDDHADPALLETLIGKLRQHPSAGLAFCQSHRVDGDTAALDLPFWYGEESPRWERDFFTRGSEEICRYMIFRNTVPNASAVVFRRDLASKAGPADESFRLSADWLFWVRLLEHSDLVYSATPLNYYRFHANTARSRYSRDGTMVEEALRIAGAILRTHAVPAQVALSARTSLIAWFIETMVEPAAPLPADQRRRLKRYACEVDPRAIWKLRARRSGLGWFWLGVRRRLTGFGRSVQRRIQT
jgi:glycosyltransferase involved in cell wall biosynthesis